MYWMHSPYFLLSIPIIIFLSCYVIFYYGEPRKTLKQLDILEGEICIWLNKTFGSWRKALQYRNGGVRWYMDSHIQNSLYSKKDVDDVLIELYKIK